MACPAENPNLNNLSKSIEQINQKTSSKYSSANQLRLHKNVLQAYRSAWNY